MAVTTTVLAENIPCLPSFMWTAIPQDKGSRSNLTALTLPYWVCGSPDMNLIEEGTKWSITHYGCHMNPKDCVRTCKYPVSFIYTLVTPYMPSRCSGDEELAS